MQWYEKVFFCASCKPLQSGGPELPGLINLRNWTADWPIVKADLKTNFREEAPDTCPFGKDIRQSLARAVNSRHVGLAE